VEAKNDVKLKEKPLMKEALIYYEVILNKEMELVEYIDE